MLYIKYFRHYIRLYGRHFWIGVAALAVTDFLDIIPPLIIGKAIDEITGNAGMTALGKTAGLFAAVTLALAIVRYHWRMQFGYYHLNLAQDLRQRIFQKLTTLGPDFYSTNSIGELMSLMTNDVEAIRMGMGPGLVILIDSIFYCLTIPAIMFYYSVSLTVKTLALLPVLPFFIKWISGIIHRRYLEVQESFGNMASITQENISGIRVIKSYVQEKNQIDLLNKASQIWRDQNLRVAKAESFMHPVMEFCVTVGMVVLLFWGGRDIVSGALTVGTFVMFRGYISKMVWPMTAIGWGFTLVAQGRASIDRVEAFLQVPPNVREVKTPREAQNLDGAIEVSQLTFKYPGSDHAALKDISLNIKPGETFGIVGPVGSGKTTLAQLLCHLYEVEPGRIKVNGHDIRDVPLEQLRKHIAFVPQDTFLFSASIGENMSFGLEKTPEIEILKKVAEVAKLDQEIESLPLNYQTYLGERGINLSGGQKQRMTITRALLRKSPVIIFDDSLSAVDAETESLILKRLREQTREHTTIIISHRLSSLSLCDRVVVLREGSVEAIGSPQELRTRSTTYRELLHLQGYT